MITEKQINNIHNLNSEDCVIILTELMDRLGVVSIVEYSKIMQINKRSVYKGIESGKIKSIPICGIDFPYINDK